MSSTSNVQVTSLPDQCLKWLQRIAPEENLWRTETIVTHLALLSNLGLDAEAQTIGILQVWNHSKKVSDAAIGEEFGTELLETYLKVERLRSVADSLENNGIDTPGLQSSDESVRKLLISMVDDVRVVVIGLSSQLFSLRQLKEAAPEEQKRQAKITQRIYAPLANRLGLWDIKWELEDLAFRYLNPVTYHSLASYLQDKRTIREKYITDFVADLKDKLAIAGLNPDVQGRPKHIFSIWKKMQKKNLEFGQVWDILAVRILCDNVDECYTALGVINASWRQFTSEFVDYIATPKNNGYQSIHVVVSTPGDRAVEVQIRTREMHQESELGFAAHWRYKEQDAKAGDMDSKVIWLRQLLEWKDEVLRQVPDQESIKNDTQINPRIFVFTPKGSIVDLPSGSTPIDFAYFVHTEVGHRTRGAKVNNKMVPLNYKLSTGDQVQIQTVKTGGPSRDWIGPQGNYVKTTRARSRIQQWFKQADFEHYVAQGRMMLDRELKKSALEELSYEKINQHTHFHHANDLLAAIGSNDYKISKALYPFRKFDNGEKQPLPFQSSQNRPQRTGESLVVHGVDNLLTKMATCCQPVPGDSIVGYVTTSRGITIHRANCINMNNLETRLQHRLIDVQWGSDEVISYILDLDADAIHSSSLLHDISDVLKSSDITIHKLNMDTNDEQLTTMQLKLEIPGSLRPDQVENRLGQVNNVLSVNRRYH